MAFAMLPTAWLTERDPHGAEIKDDGVPRYRLPTLQWQDHRMTGLAAIRLLFTLAVKLNRQNARVGFDLAARSSKVAVTYRELQGILGVAPATIGRAISLLEGWGAIEVHKLGRSSIYELKGIGVDGQWCMYPQDWLEKGGDPVDRFKHIPGTLIGLNALKIYVVLLARRDIRRGYTAISYEGIQRWTGVRRENIRQALALLVTQQLITRIELIDDRRTVDPSSRYAIYGLTPGYRTSEIKSNGAVEAPDYVSQL